MNNFKDMLRRDSVLPGDGRSHAGGQDIQVLNDDLSQGITGSHPPPGKKWDATKNWDINCISTGKFLHFFDIYISTQIIFRIEQINFLIFRPTLALTYLL